MHAAAAAAPIGSITGLLMYRAWCTAILCEHVEHACPSGVAFWEDFQGTESTNRAKTTRTTPRVSSFDWPRHDLKNNVAHVLSIPVYVGQETRTCQTCLQSTCTLEACGVQQTTLEITGCDIRDRQDVSLPSLRLLFGFSFIACQPQELKDRACEYQSGFEGILFEFIEGTVQEAFSHWCSFLGLETLGMQTLYCSPDAASPRPDGMAKPILRVAPLFFRARLAPLLLDSGPPLLLLQRWQKFFAEKLGEAGLQYGDANVRQQNSAVVLAGGDLWPNQIPVQIMIKFLAATRYLRQIRDLPRPQTSDFFQLDRAALSHRLVTAVVD